MRSLQISSLTSFFFAVLLSGLFWPVSPAEPKGGFLLTVSPAPGTRPYSVGDVGGIINCTNSGGVCTGGVGANSSITIYAPGYIVTAVSNSSNINCPPWGWAPVACTVVTFPTVNPVTIKVLAEPMPASGSGGQTNQPPSFSAGGDWLVSPDNAGFGGGGTAFVWKKVQDPDGDTITYRLYICLNGDFDNCQPLIIEGGSATRSVALGLGGAGALLVVIGFGFTRIGRRDAMILLAVLALAGAAAAPGCGSSSDKAASSGVSVASCSQSEAGSLCKDSLKLEPGDYQWKVVADDGAGGVLESAVRSFTVK